MTHTFQNKKDKIYTVAEINYWLNRLDLSEGDEIVFYDMQIKIRIPGPKISIEKDHPPIHAIFNKVHFIRSYWIDWDAKKTVIERLADSIKAGRI